MCKNCGCSVGTGSIALMDVIGRIEFAPRPNDTVDVMTGLLNRNDREAATNRETLGKHGILAVNIMSSPGSGKTALLEATIEALADRYRMAVIVGDLETENDARRIRAKDVPAIQIVTGQSCHLDARMVEGALRRLDLASLDMIFIENVGNLVCPASFDLGQHANVVLLAATEGDDKPQKYPVMFRAADLVLLSKSDLLAVLDDFSPQRAEAHVRHLANAAPVQRISARHQKDLAPWIAWLEVQLTACRANKPPAAA